MDINKEEAALAAGIRQKDLIFHKETGQNQQRRKVKVIETRDDDDVDLIQVALLPEEEEKMKNKSSADLLLELLSPEQPETVPKRRRSDPEHNVNV